MKLRHLLLTTLASLALMAGDSFAQGLLEGDSPGDPGADEPDPLDPGGLLERKVEPKKPEVIDPDAVLLKEVEARRDGLQKRIMQTQNEASRFVKLQGAVEKSTSHFLKILEAFVSEHNELMYKYREAVEAGKHDTQAKLSKQITKIRKRFLKDLTKVGKRLSKTEAEIEKLKKKLAEEGAEEE